LPLNKAKLYLPFALQSKGTREDTTLLSDRFSSKTFCTTKANLLVIGKTYLVGQKFIKIQTCRSFFTNLVILN